MSTTPSAQNTSPVTLAEPPTAPPFELEEKTNLGLQPLTPAQAPTVIETQPLPPPALKSHKARHKGHVARLPKLQRDMVGRMLANGVPYKNISHALDECGFQITERNISTWVTSGGQSEWQLEQELVLQNRLDQDHLVEHLRRDDASELPEVGLQAAATRLSQILLQKAARADNVEANLATFTQMVDLLSRLTRDLALLQKQRNDARRSLGHAHDPARIKDMDELTANEHERFYSDPPEDSTLQKPAEPPLLPPEPTSSFLQQRDVEAEQDRQIQQLDNTRAMLQALTGKKQPPPASSQTPAKPPAQ